MMKIIDVENERIFVEITGTDYNGVYCSCPDGSVYIENNSLLDTACDIAVIKVNEFLIK